MNLCACGLARDPETRHISFRARLSLISVSYDTHECKANAKWEHCASTINPFLSREILRRLTRPLRIWTKNVRKANGDCEH